MPIHLLPPEVASQIAAGEVIERPASVVKELLENALDAGATHVVIRIEGAGARSIEVADDGAGIPAAELPLAVERHATSKLTSASDLDHIRTLGFRGEALASIGSVSRLTITSRPADAASGARLRVDGGKVEPLQPAGAPQGTSVRVDDLFFNIPARLKFLKAEVTERRTVDALVTRYALAYPRVRIQLYQDGRPVLQTSGNGDQREVLAALYGVEIARQMLGVIAEEEGLSIQGFISPPSLTRSNRRELTFFINGRPVQDPALSAASLKGYHTLLMVGRYPLVILFIQMDPEKVDVNVHPTKAEVRFENSERVFSGVQRAVRRALLAHTPVAGLDTSPPWSSTAPAAGGWGVDWSVAAGEQPILPGSASIFRGTNQPSLLNWDGVGPDLAAPLPAAAPASNTAPSSPSGRGLLRLIGQVASTYLIAEGPDGLYLIDQHAAHERVLFEQMLTQLDAHLPAQSLLQAVSVELPATAAHGLHSQLDLLSRLGFQVENFGPNTFLVRAIPVLLANSDPAAALRAVVEDFEEDETPLQAQQEARLIARICKRAAVKAGKILSTEEGLALLRDLENCQSPRTCPHGRPTMIHLSVDLLERQFGRRGAR